MHPPQVDSPYSAPQPVVRLSQHLRSWQHQYSLWLRLSDAATVIVVLALAQALRFGNVTSGSLSQYSYIAYLFVSVSIGAGWAAALAIYRTRSPRVIGAGLEEYQRVWTATLSLFGGIAVVSTLLKLDIARGYLAIAFPLGLAALTLNRWIARQYVTARRRNGKYMNSVLAVGQLESVRSLAQSLARSPTDGYTVVGVCAPGPGRRESVTIPSVGEIPAYPYGEDLAAVIASSGADTVALTSGHFGPDEIRDLSWQLEKLDVELIVSPGMVDVSSPRLTVRPVGGLLLINIDRPQYDGAKRLQKRAFDVAFSFLVLLVASPVLLFAALAVKMNSRGPVFYCAERIGLDSKPFQMIKFRTMVVDADRRLADVAHLNEGGGVLFKIRKDPRVTPVGRFLRRYSVDELPQFINVLLGQMSVVGPRPPLRSEVESYNDRVRRRLLVRPGITGLWQVSGRSDLSWEDSVRLDLSYVENWSMLSDLAIAAKTFNAVLRGSGAY